MSEPTPDPTQTPNPEPEMAPIPPEKLSFERRMETFGKEVGEAGERFGRGAEAWGNRLAKDPGVQRAGDTAARVWGLLVLAVGIWFFIDVTLGYDMPRIPWGDVWPIGLIAIGLLVILRGMGRRSA